MNNALKAFMNTLVDYAGLFPPASLSVPVAVAEYARHRAEPESWMLGRFIAPAARLSEIGAAAKPLLSAADVWGFSVLVGAPDSVARSLGSLADQASQIASFEGESGGQFRAECLETAIPRETAAQPADFLQQLLSSLRAAQLGRRDIFLEVPAAGNDSGLLRAIAEAAPAHTSAADGFERISAKLRCGGVTAEAFPSCERIAEVIHLCAQLELPLKCTAGLHHPVRHLASEPEVMMHGFLNVFGAGLLAWGLNRDLDVLTACIAETDPAAFTFTEDFFAWRDHKVSVEAMRQIRGRSLSGFGSCSFEEPRSDLQSLGVL